MPNTSEHDHGDPHTADLPLIIEKLQDQVDDLTATVRALQDQLTQQSAQIAALERS